MNKIKTLVTVLIMSIASISLVGCDDDDFEEIFDDWESIDEANMLYGTWEGYLGTFYEDRWGVGGEDYITTIRFDKPVYGSSSGRGYEVDRIMNDPSGRYYYCEFSWMVSRGDIVIIYDDDPRNPVYIYDYHLTNRRFRGYMDDGTNQEIKFDFRYLSHFDWGPYYSTSRTGLNEPNKNN